MRKIKDKRTSELTFPDAMGEHTDLKRKIKKKKQERPVISINLPGNHHIAQRLERDASESESRDLKDVQLGPTRRMNVT